MKTWSNRTVLWLFLCIIFIYLVDLFTIMPSVTSGNGNVGLLFLLPALIVFFFFARSFWRILGSIQLKSNLGSDTLWGNHPFTIVLFFRIPFYYKPY